MQNIEEIFYRIQEKKRTQKEIRQSYKDALINTEGYQDLVDQMRRLRERKVSIERSIRNQSAKDFDQLDILTRDIKSDMQVLADLVISKATRGEEVIFTGTDSTTYQPEFSVRFRRVEM